MNFLMGRVEGGEMLYRLGERFSMAPQIPGMPTPLPDDSGQAPRGSQPWYSRADDIAFAETATAAVVAADAQGLTHASKHLRHYLDNSGTDLILDPDQILNDDSTLKRFAEDIVARSILKIADQAAVSNSYENSIPFQSGWDGYTFDSSSQRDWFLAIGSMHVAASGVVTVHRPDNGAQPRVTVYYAIHLHDRYNWDGQKSTKIAGVNVTDRQLGALHTAGLAQEFEQYGSSIEKLYEGVVPTNGSIDLQGPENRKDTRADPTR
ncbi:hypothetical protein AB0J47_28285 [Nocardia sp. NPDC049737]|uniref:hypothetical protein n=1 Tax=Nocardia sp. NPDC049737 TaxID=3154358 RepID=UPI00343F1267